MATKEERPIKLHEKVTVYLTEKHPYAEEAGGVGTEAQMHPEMVIKLEKAGWITKTAPKEKTKA